MAYNPNLNSVPFSNVTSLPSTMSGYGISQTDNSTLLNGVMPLATKTSNYTATASDYIILVDTTSGSVAITLPVTVATGKVYQIKKVASANTLTIAPTSGTIDGASSMAITSQYETLGVAFNGTNYFII